VVFAMIPFKLVGSTALSSRWRITVSLSSCFSGGVFVAACILDLFPDVHEAMDHVLDEIEKQYNTKIDYPVAGFVICFGFFLVLIIEQIVLEYKERINSNRANLSVNAYDETSPLLHNHNDTHNDRERSRYGSGANESLASMEAPDDAVGHEHHHDHGVAFHPHSTIRSMILLIALSFHSIFEGLAIGLQQDLGQLISLFIAVIAHKAIMAFSLGLTLAQASLSAKQYVMSIMIFSLASPFGMGIGILLADMDHSLAADVANGILQGIAGGTFLYITFFEVLPHEFNDPKHRMLKLASMLVGYSCICGLLFVTH